MINDLYTILSIFVVASINFIFGLCFLFLLIPGKPSLNNYRTARYMMACAYLFFGIINILEYCTRSAGDNTRLTQTVTLIIAVSQAFLFTFTLITLINTRFLSRRRMTSELIPLVALIAGIFTAYFTCSDSWFGRWFYLFILCYALLMIRFIRLFTQNYRRYLTQMDNYFSEQESRRLRWVYFSFFAALSIGIMALLSALFMSEVGALLFSVALIGFYCYFGIRFINYAFLFQYIETAMKQEEIQLNEKNTRASFADIEQRIAEWKSNKLFTEEGITIERLARLLKTNRTYLSTYINCCENKTFRNWINELRIRVYDKNPFPP
jgi:hypothetical protein